MGRWSIVAMVVCVLVGTVCYSADLEMSGLLQAQYVDAKDKDSDFTVRAARVKARAKITDKITGQLQFDVSREPDLLDLMIDYSHAKYLTLRFGQFTLPFGFETQASRFDLEAIERSLVISSIWNNGVSSPYIRDAGVMLMGNYKIFEYKVAAVNGVGYNYVASQAEPPPETYFLPRWGRDNNNTKDIVGRIGMGVPMFAGLGFSFYEGKWEDAQDRSAIAFDLYLDAKVVLQYEYVRGEGLMGDYDWCDAKYSGYYLVLGYKVTPLIEPVFKMDRFDPDKDEDSDRRTADYYGVNLNFERRARLQVLYGESEEAGKFVDGGFKVQVSARL
jgi:hypothetical protein